jgi:hypothetical protein
VILGMKKNSHFEEGPLRATKYIICKRVVSHTRVHVVMNPSELF